MHDDDIVVTLRVPRASILALLDELRDGAPPSPRAPDARGRTAPNAARAADKARRVVEAGRAIVRLAPHGVYTSRRELVALGASGRNAGELALTRLMHAGFVDLRGGEYAVSYAATQASDVAIVAALTAA